MMWEWHAAEQQDTAIWLLPNARVFLPCRVLGPTSCHRYFNVFATVDYPPAALPKSGAYEGGG